MVGAFLFRPSQQNHAARSPGERVSVCRIAQPPERPGDPLPENVVEARREPLCFAAAPRP